MGMVNDLRNAKAAIVRMAEHSTPSYAPPIPPPRVLEAPPVRVEALTSNWCIAGQPVEVGAIYTVSNGDAERLIYLGRARRA